MEIFLLNTDFTVERIIDTYESFIWNERYQECGDFELYLQSSSENLEIFKPGKYLVRNGTSVGMIIEDIRINVDPENGDHLTVTGRSFESILARRVVWGQTNIKTSLQSGIKTLIRNAIINPINQNRKISNFIFQDSSDSAITSLQIDAQYYGENLYDIIKAACAEAGIGFKVVLNSSNQFVFSLYSGANRSYSQEVNPWIVFSPNFENLKSAEYVEKSQGLANVAFVAGEGEGTDRVMTSVGSSSGIDRREMYVDASDISRTTDEDTEMALPEYQEKLKQKANESLTENNKALKEFKADIDATRTYLYNRDFFMGDIVSVVSEYGLKRNARILEYITSEDGSGLNTYPTFEILNEED